MPEPSLHHVGYVVRSITSDLERWRTTLMATTTSQVFEDPIQQARVLFLTFAGGATALELVEPLSEAAPTAAFLKRGGGLHHLCFEVDDVQEQIRQVRLQGGILVRQPKPAVAFELRRIAWMATREKLLIEYLERG